MKLTVKYLNILLCVCWFLIGWKILNYILIDFWLTFCQSQLSMILIIRLIRICGQVLLLSLVRDWFIAKVITEHLILDTRSLLDLTFRRHFFPIVSHFLFLEPKIKLGVKPNYNFLVCCCIFVRIKADNFGNNKKKSGPKFFGPKKFWSKDILGQQILLFKIIWIEYLFENFLA